MPHNQGTDHSGPGADSSVQLCASEAMACLTRVVSLVPATHTFAKGHPQIGKLSPGGQTRL